MRDFDFWSVTLTLTSCDERDQGTNDLQKVFRDKWWWDGDVDINSFLYGLQQEQISSI